MNAKLIPYGMTNLEAIIRENRYYVDKTGYIPLMEETDHFMLFVRPRRFGKSLFVNMLSLYYDKFAEDKFDNVFGELDIAKNPTENKNRYLVLLLNFSGIKGKTIEEIEKAFNDYCNIILRDFTRKYANYFDIDEQDNINNYQSSIAKLTYICKILERKGEQIYLIMDEYDNFANNVFSNLGSKSYLGITHGDGFFRAFMDEIKKHTSFVIDRIFLTGVSPVTMDDLTSGFNIASNLSNDMDFNAMIGFTEIELREMLEYYLKEGVITKHSVDELIRMMKPWYNNYCFSEDCLADPPMYNSDMVLYFLKYYLRTKEIPKQMIDRNVRTDYNKLRYLITIDKKFAENASVIQEILTTGGTLGTINPGFSMQELVEPNNFKSLLYYFGLLTISGSYRSQTYLSIPNQVVKEQVYLYMANIYKEVFNAEFNTTELNSLMENMAYSGEWQAYFQYISERLREQSSIREFMDGEAHVKAFLLSYMGMNNFYTIYPEYEMNKGYTDFFMQPNLYLIPDMKYAYVIEVKYAKRDCNKHTLDQLQTDATAQLHQYAQSPTIQNNLGNTALLKIALIYQGWELVRIVQA